MKKVYFLFILSALFILINCKKNKTPKDVNLNAISQDINGIQVDWDKSSDKHFQSYKLYRHLSSGIDESTGSLVHVSTSSDDITFTDLDINPSEKYYYRVYVQNKKGISNGSNIQSITSETISLVANGSFENGGSIPTDWTLIHNNMNQPLNLISIDPTKASDGNKSLKFHHHEQTGCWEMWIEQYISLSDLTAGGTYEVTLDYLSDSPFTPSGMGFKLSNSSIDIGIPLQTFPGDGVWHKFSVQFTLPANIGSADPRLVLHFCVDGVTDWWIDNFTIIKV